jgi:hypothetical protein
MNAARLAVISLLLLQSLALFAQDPRGTITGRVNDGTGAAISGASIKATNADTGLAVSTKANEAGVYVIPYLIPGTYTIEAQFEGFGTYVRPGLQVRVTEQVTLDIEMKVGDVVQTMEVKAETPLLSAAEVSLGQVIDQRRIEELPLFAGNAMDLVHLAPGTVNGTNLRLRKAPFNNAPSTFSTNGGGNYQNDFTIDGVVNIYSDGTQPRVAFSPPQTAIGEFKVQTSAFDASSGFSMGSVVNVSTKAGTNQLHGEMHHWLRHSVLDAPTIFQNRSGQSVPLYQDNRFGASAGGPVVLPKVYDGRKRTFWFYAFEANLFGDPNVGAQTSTVPIPEMRRGDLSPLLALGPTFQVYDPFSTRATGDGRFQRTPIPGNIIPASRLDPVAQNLLKAWPDPNQPGTRDFRNNYFRAGKALETYWTMIGRVDHAFNENHRMFLRFHRDYWEEDKNRNFGNDNITGIILNRINRGIALDDVIVVRPTVVVNLRYGITQQEFPEQRVSRGFDLSSLGLSSNVTNLIDKSLATFPRTNVAPFTVLSAWESGDGTTASLIHNANATVTWIRGSHSFRFGHDFRNYRENRNRFATSVSPDFSFNSNFTRGPLNTDPAPQLGGEIASFLMGVPGGSMAVNASYAERNSIYALYLQDDFKVTRKLTLNLGIRWEVESATTERYDRAVRNFNETATSPIDAAARANYARNPMPELPVNQFQLLGGLAFVNAGGNPRGYWSTAKNNFMPRFGIAYQITPKTVLRAGYGMFFSPLGTLYTNTEPAGFSLSTPIQATLDNGLTYIATTANPFPNGLQQPAGAAGGLSTNLGQNVNAFPSRRQNPNAQRWSFGFQHQLPAQFLLELSYVGNRATNLNILRNMNYTPAQYLSTSAERDQATITYLGTNFRNPMFGTNPIYGQNITRGNLLRAFPQFGNVNIYEPTGYSWYHSMQMRVEKRMSRGFTTQMSYTWSKNMEATSYLNAQDPMPYEVISGLDRPHRITASGIWEFPFGRGRKWGSAWHPVVNGMLGGWQLNGAWQHQSGAPLGFGNVIFNGDLDNVLAPKSQRGVDGWFNVNAGFERSAARQLGSNLVRFSPRFSGIRGPGQDRLDFGVIKYFQITERFRLQFRAETFNALNHPNLANPNTSVTSGAFGTITSQDPPRSWQGALKLTF